MTERHGRAGNGRSWASWVERIAAGIGLLLLLGRGARDDPRSERCTDRNRQDGDGKSRDRTTPWLEWVASGIGLVLATGTIGYMSWQAFRADDAPPAVVVRMERIVPGGAGYTVEIRAANRGDATAAQVRIEGELKRDGQTVETSETTFDYVPGRSERKGGLFFNQDPRPLTLELRAKGYAQP
ncbi:MAG: TIGR02588 family protein [Pseudomonadota bacterium]|nr:TIGR02588 family protein [Pseudomonadota bacterium]